MNDPDLYLTDEAAGDSWRLLLGDSCERLAEIETDSVRFSICSPPFAQLYNYSPSPRDLSNSRGRAEFFEHYSYIIREQLRVTLPGRLAAVHVQQITQQKVIHGVIGLTDFRGQVIRAFEDAGWIYHGEKTISKDPQAQAIRTKSQSLLFVTLRRDSAMSRPALADYLLLFRKPGDNPEPIIAELSNEEWIHFASPVWLDIRETNTLNTAVAKAERDERHICLARGTLVLTKGDGYKPIEQVNAGELVLTHKGRWRPVLARQMTGVRPGVTLRAQGVAGLTLTPDHKVWARTTNWVRERDGAEHAAPSWVEAQHVARGYVNHKLAPQEPNSHDATAWWTIGRWLADGHYHEARDGLYISCHVDELDDLTASLGRFAPAKIAAQPSAHCVQVRLRDPERELRNIIKTCGRGAAGKHLPAEAFTLPSALAAAVLDGYLSGDGHYLADRRRWMASSVSRELLLGVAMLAQRVHGAIASVYAGRADRDGTIEGRPVHMRQDWILSFDLPGGRRKKPFVGTDGAWRKVASVDDAGEIETWNLRVAEDESFTAEGVIVKNCPLQLDLIDYAVRLWSNPGDLVLSPFAGIGSEGVGAIRRGRRFLGIELKPSYYDTAKVNLANAEADANTPLLFDLDGTPAIA